MNFTENVGIRKQELPNFFAPASVVNAFRNRTNLEPRPERFGEVDECHRTPVFIFEGEAIIDDFSRPLVKFLLRDHRDSPLFQFVFQSIYGFENELNLKVCDIEVVGHVRNKFSHPGNFLAIVFAKHHNVLYDVLN